MVAMKYLRIVVAFHLFVAYEAYTQNFYAVRYGKRGDSSILGEAAAEGRRLGRRNDDSVLTDRKIRFFISGGRYGKRVHSTTRYSGGSRKLIRAQVEDFQGPRERFGVPSRRNHFMVGSRFGKRHGTSDAMKGRRPPREPWDVIVRGRRSSGPNFTEDMADA